MSADRINRKISGVQEDLFQRLETSPLETEVELDLDIQMELLGALHVALKQARKRGLSRERIADLMNQYMPELDRHITKRRIDSWLAISKEDHDFPARFIPVFCRVCQCDMPLRVMAQAIGYDLVDRRELYALELGEAVVKKAQIARKEKALRELLR